jgi:tRNA(adenine34) deaminase
VPGGLTGYEATFESAMRAALAEAEAAVATGDVPVGAVILDAIRAAAQAAGGWRLDGLTLVVTLEPCVMCAGAVTNARLSRLVYGAEDPRAGAAGSTCDVVRDQRAVPVPEVIGGVLAEECLAVLREFFARRS